MPAKTLADLVKDWGGFEKLVADLSQTGEVTVEHNVSLTGRSGAARQIDVLIRHKQGLIEHLVIVECKYWNSSVERLHVDALATTVREVGASRGVIISTAAAFQRGAIEQARHDAIELFRVREPTVEEWGRPGRHIDFYLHVLSVALGPLRIEGTFTIDPLRPTSTTLALSLGDGASESHTPAICDGRPETRPLSSS
jgi:Restriction endonuclease